MTKKRAPNKSVGSSTASVASMITRHGRVNLEGSDAQATWPNRAGKRAAKAQARKKKQKE